MPTDMQSWGEGATPPAHWWAFYVRVTREESVTADLSIPNQIARAKEVAAARGWNDYKIYVEPKHVSAELWIDKRPALKTLLDDVAAGRISGLCARHTDRFWRSNEIQAQVLRALRARGVELWDFTNKYDYTSAHGRFSLQVLGAASELEVNLTAERIREMKRGKAIKGKTGGGPPPFGYTSQSRRIHDLKEAGYSPDEAYRQACLDFPIGKCWYIDEKEAEAVRLIFELYTSPQFRLGCKRIVQQLNQRGYKTREGCAWLGNYVNKIINNPAYAGYTTYDEAAYEERLPSRLPRHKQALFPGQHEPLITSELWHKAQQIKETENTIRRPHPGMKPNASFSLTGIVRCPSCGSRLIGKWASHSARRYYICSRRHTGGADLCSFPLVDAIGLQREVWRWLHEILASPEFVMEHMERLTKRHQAEQPEATRRVAALEQRRDELKGAIAKYYAFFEASKDPARDVAHLDRVRELRAELQAVEGELAVLKSQVAPTPRKLTVERVRMYLDKLLTRVEAHPEHQRVLFQEFKREHDLQVRAVSKTEFTVSLALPTREMLAEHPTNPGGERVYSVLVGTPANRGSKEPGSPEPGGPIIKRLWAPAAAISRARRAPCWPRTSERSWLSEVRSGENGGSASGTSSAAPSRKCSRISERWRTR